METSDHAKLNLELTYNWYFKFDKTQIAECEKLFSVRDFIGDACKSLASRIRGAVSAITFEVFHGHNAVMIKEAVFGKKAGSDELRTELLFKSNLLCITSVDIHNIGMYNARHR